MSQACEPEQWHDDPDEIDRELAEREEEVERDRNPQAYGERLHAGTNALTGKALWHRAEDGYFCGHHYHRTPQQLLAECQSTISDLLRNHPELRLTKAACVSEADLAALQSRIRAIREDYHGIDDRHRPSLDWRLNEVEAELGKLHQRSNARSAACLRGSISKSVAYRENGCPGLYLQRRSISSGYER